MELFIIDKLKTKELYNEMLEFIKVRDTIGQQRDTAVVIGGE